MDLYVFDLDHTLLTTNSSYQFFQFLIRHKIFPLTSYCAAGVLFCRYRLLKMPLSELHHKVFEQFLLGLPLHTLEKHLPDFILTCIAPSLYAPALTELRRAQHMGHQTMILSSSPDFLVEKIAHFLRVEEWKGSKYLIDKQRCLCKIASIIDGQAKAQYVLEIAAKKNISPQNVVAFSDSYSDLPLLLVAGRSVSVNPDSKLRRLSQAKGWTTI